MPKRLKLFVAAWLIGTTGAQAWLARANNGGDPLTPTLTMKSDLAHREHDIRWPDGFDPETADLFAHNEILVAAPCGRVWAHIVDASAWPQWYPNAHEVALPAGAKALSQGLVFQWKTFGLSIESRVLEYEPERRLGWTGGAPNETPGFYHTWYLSPENDHCRVVTEEVGKGEGAKAFRAQDEGLMHRGHDLWLACLRWMAEGPR